MIGALRLQGDEPLGEHARPLEVTLGVLGVLGQGLDGPGVALRGQLTPDLDGSLQVPLAAVETGKLQQPLRVEPLPVGSQQVASGRQALPGVAVARYPEGVGPCARGAA